jgi:glutamyl-tRNA synthetase
LFRFAPSPRVDFSIRDLQIALFNFIISLQKDEKLHIHLKDIDIKQNIDEKVQEILELLTLFKISYSDVTYQSHNIKFHQQLATKLLMDKNAFSCFCTSDDIQKAKEEAKSKNIEYQYNSTCENLSDEEVLNNEKPFSIRVKRPDKDITFKDEIIEDITFKKESIDSFVILEVDKTPTYNFACSLDDMLSDISMVIKGQESLSDTPKQILLRDYLGYDKKISYAHIPIILNESGKKMSETDEAYSIKWLLDEGYLPQAISNYLILILIEDKTQTEIFTLDEVKEWFDLKNISKSPVKFDIRDLKRINREHIKKLSPLELAKFIGFSSSDLGELAKIYTKECSTINEIKPKIDAIFAKKDPTEFIEEFKKLQAIAKDAPYFKEYDEFKNYISNKSGLKGENLLKPLRFLLTGSKSDLDLSVIYPHIKNYLGEIIR